MRLDHLLSKEEEVEDKKYYLIIQVDWIPIQYGDTFLVAMRLGDTPVPIPNTMVKTQAADDTALETVWESRWLPNL